MECITHCRICKTENLSNVIDLGEQYITSRFPQYGDWSTLKTPITICKCQQCGLVQLKQTTFSSELYEFEYGYRSGINNTMRTHLANYQKEIIGVYGKLENGDVVVDIGSNDSTMLQCYSSNIQRIGVDPTGSQFKQFYGDVELIPTYFTCDNFRQVYPNLKPKIVSSISMFYDLPDPVQFAQDIYDILDDQGIWTCEQSYLPSMLKTNSIDTICHEHLEYYALHQVKDIADRVGFKIINVFFNDCNGGSFRVYFAKKESDRKEANIEKILKDEIEFGIFTDKLYSDFMKSCDYQIDKLKTFINMANQNEKQVWIYGASTKGNCLLQYADIGEKDVKYAVERNLSKVGKMTSTGIEIISEETMRANPPAFLLVLPWHFRDEIVKREHEFLENGGQLIFPFPKFEIVSNKPKVLITGIDGMISQYVLREFQNYTCYGIGRQNLKRTTNTFAFDLTEAKMLEKVIDAVQPSIIIHLASISSAQYALNNPLETCLANGLITVSLCEMIHKNKWNIRLFNASSSELYKGHSTYTVQEDDKNMNHLHPYSIGKKMAHEMVQFYRKTYGLPFSNGVLFTIESHLKRPEFLLNKVKQHSLTFPTKKEFLNLGPLTSYRNILHASDAAKAIKIIVEHPYGDDYLICNKSSVSVYDMVVQVYKAQGIELVRHENKLYDQYNNHVINIQDGHRGFDDQPTNIMGNAIKLTSLGWVPEYSISDICN